MRQASARGAGFSDAAERNARPIIEVLRRRLPGDAATVLEIASGTGQHAVHCARALPGLQWQPSDVSADALASIGAWRQAAGLTNLRAPLELDVRHEPWPIDHAHAIVCINLLHIAPWDVAPGLAAGAARRLPPGGELLIYGPFRIGGRHTADSNARFDERLRATDPRWGLRDLERVVEVMAGHDLLHLETVPMPANNRMLAFGRPR
jgi:SAM-dependent methyltransferase